MASEPYSEEAPSVRISTRSMIEAGMVLRSTAAETPEAEDSLTKRRPSTSTRTRLAPRCRSEMVVEPEPTPPPSAGKPKLPAELNLVLIEEPLTDSRWMMSPTDATPVCWSSAEVMTSTGESPTARLMREPVTSTVFSCTASVSTDFGAGRSGTGSASTGTASGAGASAGCAIDHGDAPSAQSSDRARANGGMRPQRLRTTDERFMMSPFRYGGTALCAAEAALP